MAEHQPRTPQADTCPRCGTTGLGTTSTGTLTHLSKRYDNGARYNRGWHSPERCETARRARDEAATRARQDRLRSARHTAFLRLIDMIPTTLDDDAYRAEVKRLSARYRDTR